jgi:hypothetical protein
MRESDLSGADLARASFVRADLTAANLTYANLHGANLERATLEGAKLSGAILTDCSLRRADLTTADMSGAMMRNCDLSLAQLIDSDLREADMTGCRVYGVSAWDVNLTDAIQTDLVITRSDQTAITIDNLELAQFTYLLLNNSKVRSVVDTIATKAVLILGRFTPERKPILDALRDELRRHNYVPVLLDFEKPATRDLSETISTLAHISRFIIADLTEARSLPQELARIVPFLPSVPIVPLIRQDTREFSMFADFSRYPWVSEFYEYRDAQDLLVKLTDKIIPAAEARLSEGFAIRNRQAGDRR